MIRSRCLLWSAALLSACLFSSSLSAAEWLPLDSADTALQKPRVDPNADAECLLWDVHVANELMNRQDSRTTYTNYVRIKIFTEAGVKKFGTVNLTFENKEHIGDVSGRTIEPDGSIVELKKDAIFNTVVAKLHRKKMSAVSFAMPGVKVGAILEYRYKKFEDAVYLYQQLDAQMEIPVDKIVYHVKPINDPDLPYRMRYMPYNLNVPPFKQEGATGFSVTTVENMPAFEAEEDAPPDESIKSWLWVYYSEDRKEDVARFWKTEGKNRYKKYSQEVKVNGDVKDIAEQAVSGAKSDEEKLQKLYYYCQKNIKNIDGPESTDADRQAFKPNHNSAETLKHGVGSGHDINTAFLSLATAEGFEARLAYLRARDEMIFQKETMIPFLPIDDVAVSVNGKWRFYDPSTRYLSAGELRWQEQGIEALIADPKEPEFVEIDLTSAEQSKRKQMGRLKLDEDGTLEGDLDQTLGGQIALEWRMENISHSAAEREKSFSDEMKQHFPGAEVSNIQLSDPTDLANPVTLKCHVKVEGFATRTGKRLFFTPAVFQVNNPARYTNTNRKFGLLFHYPWSEQEDVSITFPDGFSLDHPDLAAPLNFGTPGGYSTTAMATKNRILYHREFTFGKDGSFFFPVKFYPTVKKIFDVVHDNDAHLLSLRQDAAVAEAQ